MTPTFQAVLVPINPAGWPFIAIGAAITILLSWLWPPLGWIGAAATAWVAYFFRDPHRVTPARPGLVVSPADGIVQPILKAPPPAELGMGAEPLTRISIFLNVFDVHVNRVPADGEVITINYRPGKFVNAALDKASEDNERMSVRLRLPDSREIAFVQIAGLVARRIVCDLKTGQKVSAGTRYGLIRFGSRCDVYLPDGVAPLVVAGQRAVAGETVLADLNSGEPARIGEVR
ncbi:MAG TPA: phosphatidylserine decarboxylase [Alphaproteobacteria bacterium]|nr:phosphatidylserine decarboxylase [Alphaproteobacteria bacterium]